MKINCKLCGEIIELPVALVEGQHVLCPYCGGKFAYTSHSANRGKSNFARIKLPEKDNRAKRRVGGKRLVIAGALLAASIVLIGGWLLFKGNSTAGIEFDCKSVNAEHCLIGEEAVESVLNSAKIGTAYFHAQGDLTVWQVLPKCGVLVGARNHKLPTALVLTKRTYIDDVELCPGLYACVGTARYPNKDGFIKTVLVFEEAESKVAQERLADIARRKAEEETKRQKHAEEVRLERAKAEMAARAATEKARIEAEKARQETEAKLAKMKIEEEARMAKLRQEEAMEKEKRRVEAEKEAMAAKAKAEAEAAEEARKRYPEEQRLRAEYASNTLSTIKFDLKEYFIIEKSWLPLLKSSGVTEEVWRQMKKASKEKNWLGILSVAAGEELKDYPSIQEIDALVKDIVEREFHAEFEFNLRLNQSLNRSVFSEENGLHCLESWFRGGVIVFTIEHTRWPGNILLYENHKINAARRRYTDLCEQYQRDVELGKIEQTTADQKKHALFEAFKKEVLSIMARSGFKARASASHDDRDDLLHDLDGEVSARSSRTSGGSRTPAKKKREIDPRLKTFR